MKSRKRVSGFMSMLLLCAAFGVASTQAADRNSHSGRGAASRAVLLPPTVLPADDPDKDASGYAKAQMAQPPGLDQPIQKLKVKANDLTANQRYRIEVADRAENGPNVARLGVFLTDDSGELEVEFHSMGGPDTPGHVELQLGNIANVLAIDAIRIFRVDEAAPDGTVIRETLVLEGKFSPVGDQHRGKGRHD